MFESFKIKRHHWGKYVSISRFRPWKEMQSTERPPSEESLAPNVSASINSQMTPNRLVCTRYPRVNSVRPNHIIHILSGAFKGINDIVCSSPGGFRHSELPVNCSEFPHQISTLYTCCKTAVIRPTQIEGQETRSGVLNVIWIRFAPKGEQLISCHLVRTDTETFYFPTPD